MVRRRLIGGSGLWVGSCIYDPFWHPPVTPLARFSAMFFHFGHFHADSPAFSRVSQHEPR
jgi:hypothetical protein